MDDDLEPTPEGLIRCLQVLAEEAACMSLSRTFAVLQDAISTCQDESDSAPFRGRAVSGARLVH